MILRDSLNCWSNLPWLSGQKRGSPFFAVCRVWTLRLVRVRVKEGWRPNNILCYVTDLQLFLEQEIH